jgi:hypothetical protein
MSRLVKISYNFYALLPINSNRHYLTFIKSDVLQKIENKHHEIWRLMRIKFRYAWANTCLHNFIVGNRIYVMWDIELCLLHSIMPPSIKGKKHWPEVVRGPFVWGTLVRIILKNSVTTCQKIHCFSITKTNWLMLYTAIIAVSFHNHTKHIRNRDSAVGIATGYGLDGRGVGVRVPVRARFFTSPRRPDVLSNGYWGIFLRGQSGRGVKLTTRLQPVPRSRIRGSIHPLPHTFPWRSA